MIDLEFVESLIRALDESSLDSLELERGGTRIRLSKTPCPTGSSEVSPQPSYLGSRTENQPPPPVGDLSTRGVETPGDVAPLPVEEPPPTNLIEVTSPMVGTFYRSPSPDSDPYVDVGARIGPGSVLCIIEAMKLMNELESEVQGTVAKILVENAEPVEYGQVLFLIDPS